MWSFKAMTFLAFFFSARERETLSDDAKRRPWSDSLWSQLVSSYSFPNLFSGLLNVANLMVNIFDSTFSFTIMVTYTTIWNNWISKKTCQTNKQTKNNTSINKPHMTLSSSLWESKLHFLYLSFWYLLIYLNSDKQDRIWFCVYGEVSYV